jgi:hypothetical protein
MVKGTTMGLGSIISQTIIEDRGLMELDWDRIIRFAAFGYLFSVKILIESFQLIEILFIRVHLFDIGFMV